MGIRTIPALGKLCAADAGGREQFGFTHQNISACADGSEEQETGPGSQPELTPRGVTSKQKSDTLIPE